MINFIKKIFARKDKKIESIQDDLINYTIEDTTYTEEIVDDYDRFVSNFVKKGGKFLYAENEQNIYSYIRNILQENPNKIIWCCSDQLKKKIEKIENTVVSIVPQPQYQINFIECEYLIANNGSVLISSDQTHNRKVNELSNRYVIFAKTNQMVASVEEGLKKIKHLKTYNLPTNITTLQPGYSRLIYVILTED